VKRPSESSGAWDYLKVLKIIPGDKAFRPMEEGNCAFVK
jgi:branched-chain amino acid transport system substrate-binding protein